MFAVLQLHQLAVRGPLYRKSFAIVQFNKDPPARAEHRLPKLVGPLIPGPMNQPLARMDRCRMNRRCVRVYKT